MWFLPLVTSPASKHGYRRFGVDPCLGGHCCVVGALVDGAKVAVQIMFLERQKNKESLCCDTVGISSYHAK